ncbi:MAG: hypothetical protein ACXWUG_07615 [Polyangiales bacterium]
MSQIMSLNPALQKVFNVMGAERGRVIVDQTLKQLGVRELRTPDDRLRFGNELIKHGGLLESVGRAIKIQAILHGAADDDR